MSDEYVADYASAVLPVLGWVQSNDWMEAYFAHGADFYSEMAQAFESPVDDILAQLPTAFYARAARCSFEDFLTAEYESTPSNALDQYLDEVGINLERADVEFLKAFRTSVVRVYYVVARTPDEFVELRDLSGGARPIQIEDEMLTAALSPGDKIATRVVTINDKDYLAGSILVLSDETLEIFKQAFEMTFKAELNRLEKYLQKDLRQRNLTRLRVLKGAAAAVSGMWLADVLVALEGTPPLANEDDPETVFQAVVPYDSQLEAIVECLEAHPDLVRPIAKEFFWLWHNDRSDPEASLKTTVWISGPEIYLESCERSRIEEAIGILQGLLGDALEEPRIREVDSIEDWVGYDEDEDEGDDEEDEDYESLLPMPMSEEEDSAFRKRIHLFLDEQFRSALDDPVEELKDRVPRELAKTVKGRKQVRRWLLSLEARIHANTTQIGLADYDFTWMWKELGMEDERQSSLFE